VDPVTLGLVYGGVNTAAGLAQGLLTGGGSWRTNYENRQMVRAQMAFQERMSSTAYQRAVGDARAAGLNPALMYSQGGASSPVGASAHMENAVGAGVSAYQQARMQQQEIKESESRVDLNDENRRTQMDQQEYLRAQKLNMQLMTRLAKYGEPALANSARVEAGQIGKAGAYADRVLKTLNSARSLLR